MILVGGVLAFLPGFLPFRTGKILIVEFALFTAIALLFIKNIWIRLFLLWCILRVILGINQYSQLSLHLLVFVLVFYQILTDKLNKDRVVHLLNIVCVIAILQTIMVILQRCGIWWTILPIGYKEAASISYFKNSLLPLFIFRPPINIDSIGGFVGDTNTASALLGMCLPAFFRKKWHWFIPLILIGFFIIHAFGGIVAGTVALIVFLIFKFGKRSLYGIIPTGLLFIAYFIRFENLQNIFISGSNRFEVWRFYIQHLIPKRWIIGWGLGQGEFLWPIIEKETSFKNVMYWHSHNEIITMTAELGLIGLVIICGYFFTTFKKLKDPVIICGLIACLTASLSIFTFHSAIGLILIVYMAIAHYQLLTNKEVSNV